MKTHLSRLEALERFTKGIKKAKTEKETRNFLNRANLCMTLTNFDISFLQDEKLEKDAKLKKGDK